MSKKYRILSLDGGGIRGLMSAIWLARLEEKLKKAEKGKVRDHFDLIAGTSTGALLACAVAKGLRFEKIIDLYVERGQQVFPAAGSRLWSRASRLFSEGVSAPKYDGKGLEKELRRVFKTSTLGKLKPKTMITTYDVFNRQSVVIKSYKDRHAELPVWHVPHSAAAPTFFPAHVLELGGAETPLIDGGVVANNPTACAIAEGARLNAESNSGIQVTDFVVASFGTGESTRPITVEESLEWGASQWVLPLIDVLFDGSADSVHYIASQLIGDGNYFRFQTQLSDAYDDMDNASKTNVNALRRIASHYIEHGSGGRDLDQLVELL